MLSFTSTETDLAALLVPLLAPSLICPLMGQEVPTAKGPAKAIRPLPGWHGAQINLQGQVAVYSKARHAIYSLPCTSNMTVSAFKSTLSRAMHKPSLQLKLYWTDRLLEDWEELAMLTPETLLRVEIEESEQTAASTELQRVSESCPKPHKANSVELWPLRTDLSDLSVPDLELRAKRPKAKRRSTGSQI